MKIWKAELCLMRNEKEEWESSFCFKLEDKDYKESSKFKEWIHCSGWIVYRVPMNMVVESSESSNPKVVQGFDHELTEEELKTLELEMRKLLRKQVEYEKDNYLKAHMEKLSAI